VNPYPNGAPPPPVAPASKAKRSDNAAK